MNNALTKHLEDNGLDLDYARQEIQDFDFQLEAIIEAGKEYRESGLAGSLVEAIAIFWADLCLVGLHEVTDPYSLYGLAYEMGV